MSLTAEQIAARKTGLGGTDMSVVLGVNPWKTPAELWAEKTELIAPEDLDDNELVHFGNVLEDVVASEYVRRRSARENREVKVRRVNRTLRHRTLPTLLANLDRDILGEPRVLECKTADKWSAGKWGDSFTDQVPDHYIIQAQTYAEVCDVEDVHLAVLIGGNEYREYVIRRDREIGAFIVEEARDFWRHVENKERIEVDPTDARAIDALRRIYPGTDGSTVVADAEDEAWRTVCQSSTTLSGEYEKTANQAKAHLMRKMRSAAIMKFADGSSLTRGERKRKAFTVEATTFWQATFVKAKED